ncbi:Serine protease inhibitor serpin-like protein OS=Thermococcus sp. (strain CGMCC 1.5172 / 4557) GN=GQS_06270 PE=3 SV=1: Serpin [Gemmata massiliana]|uniref:Serpin domain-containing protein n=1 Tax=Gemmata massiliana TaxID=1210884 RepID=A0A6P2DM25_9BACT|nr:serpin family protein [Gemmata massiliana]VTS03130.1 Serine protease inhibitor serpin-like protein OS=Thermococcus sp. (strain CGMCC 1.5172 / 4557) GN=GQS_06270 PE=3 SV=1: Serpin [Gemmata massiliana]
MHPSHITRRRFLTAASALTAGGLFGSRLRACPNLGGEDPLREAKELAAGINAFGHELHRRLAKGDGSTFFSPFSIEAALGMTSAGAKGKTLEEMQKTLHLPTDPHPAFGALIAHLNRPTRPLPSRAEQPSGPFTKRGYELNVANAIWAMKDYPWRKEFMDLTRKHYGSGVVETDFRKPNESRQRINSWVEKETQKRIKNLIPDGVLSPLTRMVLTNAIYFKSAWLHRFAKENTKDAPFTRGDGTKVDVPLMAQTGRFEYGEFDLGLTRASNPVQVLELPYTNNELSMLVFLPKGATTVEHIVTALTSKTVTNVAMKLQTVNVFLPRFKIETEYSLNAALIDLGMKAAFRDADFTGMHTSDEHLFITHVLHKAFVDVDEEGTEAAAATAVILGREIVSANPQPKEFRADRPFVFAIRDNTTNATLFLGRYCGPAK